MRSNHSFHVLVGVLAVSAALGWQLRAEPPKMPELVDLARHHSLPMPPAEARLVLAHTEAWSVLGNQSTSRDPGIYAPAFLLEEKADGTVSILRGAEKRILTPRRGGEKLYLPWSLERVTPKQGGHVADFSRLSVFVCAVQLAVRGDEQEALRLWARAEEGGHIGEAEFLDDAAAQLKDPPLLLARCLFDYWRNQLLTENSDWNQIHTRMGGLLEEFPALKQLQRPAIFDGLTKAVQAKAAADGTIESLLVAWSRLPGRMRHLGLFDDHTEKEDAPARQIVLRGFDAVPGLLELLGDQRITAHAQPAVGKGAARLRTLGELSADLLEEITGVSPQWDRESAPGAEFRAWWENHRSMDEAAALTAAAFTREKGRISSANEGPLRILAAKFPERLAPLCDEFSKQAGADAQPYALAEAIAESPLPKENKSALLTAFASRGSTEHRRCVLQNLARVDGAKGAELVIPLLRNLPKDVKGEYWTCPEASFTHVVMELEDDAVWREFLAAARRAVTGLRMQYMNPMNYSYIGDRNRERRIAFLAAFLGDSAVRSATGKDRKKFEGPCAAFTFPEISVRDFAAMQIASIVDMPDAPDEFWTAPQWSALRTKVQAAVNGMKLPSFDAGSQ